MTDPENFRDHNEATFSSANNAELLQAAQTEADAESTASSEPVHTRPGWDETKAATMQPFVHPGSSYDRDLVEESWIKLQGLHRPGLLEERLTPILARHQADYDFSKKYYDKARASNNEESMKRYGESMASEKARMDEAEGAMRAKLDDEIAAAQEEYDNRLRRKTATASELYDADPAKSSQHSEAFAQAVAEFEPLVTQREAAASIVRAVDSFESKLDNFQNAPGKEEASYLDRPSRWDNSDRYSLDDVLDEAIPSRRDRLDGIRGTDNTEHSGTGTAIEAAVNDAYAHFDQELTTLTQHHESALKAINTQIREAASRIPLKRPARPDNYDKLTRSERDEIDNRPFDDSERQAVIAQGEEQKRTLAADVNERRRAVLQAFREKARRLLAEKTQITDKFKHEYMSTQ